MDESQRGAGLVFRFDPDSRSLFAASKPNPQSASVDEAWLLQTLSAHGWGQLYCLPSAVQELLSQYNQGATVAELKLAECRDAHLTLTVSADGMEALLEITPAQGGSTIDADAVTAALEAKGIAIGVLHDAIEQAVASQSVQGMVVARGFPPVNGADGWLECLLPMVRSRVPKVDEYNHTDYRDLGEIFAVHAGEALMLRHPATEGVTGITVEGKPVPAKAGKDTHYATGLTGVEFAPDNPDLLLAATAGQPVQVSGGMIVEPVYTVPAVNAASGNIRFDGSVVIKGDVQAGMAVYATGDIEVGGVVEPATLEAGGNIVIKGGAMGGVGRNDAYYLRCGGTFNAGYASQARIDAGDSIFIDDSAIQCELSAVNTIRVGNKKSGHIIGGKAQATFSIVGKVVGSPKRVKTRFEIGVNPVMHKQLTEVVKQREGKETQLFELSKIIEFARKNPGKVQPEVLEKARKAAATVTEAIKEIRAQQDLLEQKIELSQQSQVVAEQAVFEGVEVWLGGQQYKITGEHGSCAIGIDEKGQLTLQALSKPGAHP